jgi:hypothetical protein
MKYTINKSKLNDNQTWFLTKKIQDLNYGPTLWEGNYTEVEYNQDNPYIDPGLSTALSVIAKIVDVDQDFNTIIVKRFEVGNYVIPHRDSRNTVGKSVNVFVGADTQHRYDGSLEDITSGDVIVQECTNGYDMGPRYSMNPLKDGIAYTVTLCTILKENPV